MSFSNKVVIVTGASSGIGAATAILFSKEGADVVMVGRNETKLKNVAEQCAKEPLVIKADVSNDDDAIRIIEETVQKFGKIDVLVNNAGMTKNGSILDGNILAAYDETLSTNLRAVINITTLAAPYLVASKGNIINISSVVSQCRPAVSILPYGISKSGLDHFTKGAALELSSSGVRVNSINPGPVRTDILENTGQQYTWEDMKKAVPLKRVSDSEEIAELIMYVASDKAKGITGSILVSDNGTLLSN